MSAVDINPHKSVGRGGQRYRIQQSSIDAMRHAAWEEYLHDYVNGVDDDPADARARYRAQLAKIDQMERGK